MIKTCTQRVQRIGYNSVAMAEELRHRKMHAMDGLKKAANPYHVLPPKAMESSRQA